jgi:hypothetical protein
LVGLAELLGLTTVVVHYLALQEHRNLEQVVHIWDHTTVTDIQEKRASVITTQTQQQPLNNQLHTEMDQLQLRGYLNRSIKT